MGYFVADIAPPGADGAAYKDPLGTVAPRIRVQVKHREQKVTIKEVECPHCRGHFQMPPLMASVPPPVIMAAVAPAMPAKQELPPAALVGIRFRALAPYIERCGMKSAILQAILFARTVLFGLLAFFFSMPSATEFRWAEYGVPQGQAAVTGWVLSGIVCPIVVWALVGLPLLIAAIAALKAK